MLFADLPHSEKKRESWAVNVANQDTWSIEGWHAQSQGRRETALRLAWGISKGQGAQTEGRRVRAQKENCRVFREQASSRCMRNDSLGAYALFDEKLHMVGALDEKWKVGSLQLRIQAMNEA